MLKQSYFASVLALAATLALTTDAAPATIKDATGTIVQGVAQSGSFGMDYSVNVPTLPAIGAGFGSTGPYANYVLVQTVPANAARISIDVENTSGAQIVVLVDDGTAASGAAPNNPSLIPLGGGVSSGAQGGSWSSLAEKGRIQVYAPSSSAFVTIRAN